MAEALQSHLWPEVILKQKSPATGLLRVPQEIFVEYPSVFPITESASRLRDQGHKLGSEADDIAPC